MVSSCRSDRILSNIIKIHRYHHIYDIVNTRSYNHVLPVSALRLHNRIPPEPMLQWSHCTVPRCHTTLIASHGIAKGRLCRGSRDHIRAGSGGVRVLRPNLLEQFQTGQVIKESGVFGYRGTTLSDEHAVVFKDAFRAGDEEWPQEVHVGLDGGDMPQCDLNNVLNARMAGWEVGIGKSFAVEDAGVTEGFGDVEDVGDVLRSDHL